MFSVIIPIYNKENHIEKAISSVLSQTCVNYELIVVDDGSTDMGLEVIQRIFENENIKNGNCKLIHQPNSGVSTARNNGVAAASFPYIAFLDADDWWHPDYLLHMKELIEKYPDAGIYGSSYLKVKNRREIPAKIGVEEGFQDGLINYFQVYATTLWMPLWTGATIIKKSVFEEFNGFAPKLKLGEDFYLWTQVAAKYPVALLNTPLAYYNQDVELDKRAVGARLYEPHEHMLFAGYPASVVQNKDFRFLFQRLALYGLMPYYAAKKNYTEVKKVLSFVEWRQHEPKYFIFYKIMSPTVLRGWLWVIKLGSLLKRKIYP